MADSTGTTGPQGQVLVNFVTTSSDIQLPEEKRQLRVPTDSRRYQLSQILNHESMLDTTTPIPFDFLINGTFLRTTIDEYLTTQGLSSESTIDLQYVRSLIPPLFQASFQHDDWVSALDILSPSSPAGLWNPSIDVAGHERIISASYDGLLRIWNKSGEVLATSPGYNAGGHSSGAKAVKWLSPTQFASSGLDRTVRIWSYNESKDHLSATLKPTMELYGHKGSIDALAVHTPSSRILSASTDGAIGLWTTSKSTAPAAPSTLLNTHSTMSKRRKLTTSTSTPQRGPLALIQAHSAPVTSVNFHPDDPTVAYSTSQDHTLKTLDLETGTVVDTRTTSHPLLALTTLPSLTSGHVLAAGTSARHITLIDPRISTTNAKTSIMTLRGHTNKIVSLAADPDSVWGMVSASHDGTCRVWDLRSTRAGTRDEGGGVVGESVYVVERESRKGEKKVVAGDGIKVFGVGWDRDVGIVSGGEDKRVQINSGRGITKSD